MAIRHLSELRGLDMARREYENKVRMWERMIRETADQDKKYRYREMCDEDQSILDSLVRLVHRLYREHKSEPEGAEEAG